MELVFLIHDVVHINLRVSSRVVFVLNAGSVIIAQPVRKVGSHADVGHQRVFPLNGLAPVIKGFDCVPLHDFVSVAVNLQAVFPCYAEPHRDVVVAPILNRNAACCIFQHCPEAVGGFANEEGFHITCLDLHIFSDKVIFLRTVLVTVTGYDYLFDKLLLDGFR